MKRLLSKWFSRTPDAVRGARATTSRRRHCQPGLEVLEDRLTPAVSVSLSGGVLKVVGDEASNSIMISRSGSQIVVQDPNQVSPIKTVAASQVNKLYFDGKGGDDLFFNATNLAAEAYGGAGNDTLIGGTGADKLHGGDHDDYLDGDYQGYFALSAGSGAADVLDGGAGADALQWRPGAFVRDRSGANLMLGQVDDWRPWDQPDVAGVLAARVQGKVLTLTGPTGYGFQLEADGWTASSNSQGAETFKSTGTVKLRVAFGAGLLVPLPGQAVVTTTADPWAGLGKVANVSLGTWEIDQFFSQLPELNDLLPGTDLPSVAWGVKLGKDIKAAFAGAPLNEDAPYLFYGANAGASTELAGVGVAAGAAGLVAFDPSDPFIYAGFRDSSVTGFAAAVGFSYRGFIPFTAKLLADGATGDVYGNYFTDAEIPLDKLGIPIGVNGGAVIDFDADDDGTFLGYASLKGLTGALKQKMAGGSVGGALDALLGAAGAVVKDVKYAVNGGLTLDLPIDGVGLSLALADGTFIYQWGEVSFRAVSGSEAKPFGSGVLSALNNTIGGYDVQGVYKSPTNFTATVVGKTKFLGGLGTADLTLAMGKGGVFVHGSVATTGVPFGSIDVFGRVTNKGLTLQGIAQYSMKAKVLGATLGGSSGTFFFTFTANKSTVQASCFFVVTIWGGYAGFGVSATATGSLAFSIKPTSVTISGGGSASGNVHGNFGLWKPSVGISSSFAVDSNGFRFKLPLIDQELKLTW